MKVGKKQTAAQGVGAQRGGETEVKAANFRDSDYVRDGLCASAKSGCPHATFNPRLLPSRATLARRWPRLKINRLNWKWVDDASGARGDDLKSLLAFLDDEGAR